MHALKNRRAQNNINKMKKCLPFVRWMFLDKVFKQNASKLFDVNMLPMNRRSNHCIYSLELLSTMTQIRTLSTAIFRDCFSVFFLLNSQNRG